MTLIAPTNAAPKLHYTVTCAATTTTGQTSTATLPASTVQNVDGTGGSSAYVVPNQGTPVTVTAAVGIPQPGAYGTIHGRFNTFNVINNPA